MFARQVFRSLWPSSRPLFPISTSTMSSRKILPSPKSAQPREFPTCGFELIDPSCKIEEERLPFYKQDGYYSMRIGELIKSRYQVVAKLGYGTSSMVWLSHDLREEKYWVLKVHINTLRDNQELKVYRHIAGVHLDDHPGREHVRRLKDSFKLKGLRGEHDVSVMVPLGMSLRTLQEMQKDAVFQRDLVVRALDQVLLGLNFLHEANVIHTGRHLPIISTSLSLNAGLGSEPNHPKRDLHSDNLLFAITDDSVLSKVEENEMQSPCARKQVGDVTTYVSQYMLGGAGPLTICDLGQARIGGEQRGNAMPLPYRAPEVILNMGWGTAVDTWSAGLLAWDLLERESLFRTYDSESEVQNDAHHAAMTALLGAPPPEFLRRSAETSKYWNDAGGSLRLGQWHGPVPLPSRQKLESLTSTLAGEDAEMFLNFLQCILRWLPEERLTTLQAYFHPWLRGKGS